MGWAPASALKISDVSAKALAVAPASPVAQATLVQPTEQPKPATSTPQASPTTTATPTPTPAPSTGPDLSVGFASPTCALDSNLTVILRNVGAAPILNRSVQITSANAGGIVGTANIVVNLQPGEAASVVTGQIAKPPRVTARVVLLGTPTDINTANDSADCIIPVTSQVTPVVLPTVVTSPTSTSTSGSHVPGGNYQNTSYRYDQIVFC
jgi:hypothetical protein